MMRDKISAHEARQTLHDIIRSDRPFEEKAHEALELDKRYLGVDNGYLTQIDQETDHWEIVVTTDTENVHTSSGLELELQETYCREAIKGEFPFALHDASEQGWDDDPAFEISGHRTYLGIPLIPEKEPYGTVCFAAQAPRPEPFTKDEIEFADHLTRLLEREHEKKTRRERAHESNEPRYGTSPSPPAQSSK